MNMSHCKWLQWMHVFFLKMTVHYMLVSHALQQFCNLHKPKKVQLTTALLSGGWVPKIPRSFHYWQPAPRWRSLPWLGNPGDPAMSPHVAGKKAGTRHTENISGKGGRKDGEENWVPMFMIHPRWMKHTKSWWTHKKGWTLNALDNAKMHTGPTARRILVFAISHTPLASKVTQALLAVNSVKLHLTALN